MQNDPIRAVPRAAAPKGRLRLWSESLATTKVTPVTVIVFITGLGVLCFLASCIGYLAHHLRH